MTTEQRQLMDTGFDDLNDINVTSLVGYRDSLLQKQTLKQFNGQNIEPSNIVSLTKSSSYSSKHLSLVTKSTQNDQHQEKSKTSKEKVIKKRSYKCEWDLCDKVFFVWKDLRTHVLNVHVDRFDEKDGEDSGEVLVETKADEQANPMNQDEIVEIDDQSSHISHNHESTTNAKSLKSSQQLLIVGSNSNEQAKNEMVLEDDTDLDEQAMDDSDLTDDEKFHQSEHPLHELNKPVMVSKSMNPNETILRQYRCWYCDDSFEKVECLKKHFEAFHSRKTGEELESDSDDHSLGKIDSVEMDLEGTDSDEESSEEMELSNRDLDEHSKNELDSGGTDWDELDLDEKSSEETISKSEKNLHSQKLETQQQTLNKSINEMNDQDGVDCQDGKIEVIDDSRKLHYATTGDNEPKGSNINKHSQQLLVHPVTEVNESTNQSSFNCPECGKSFRDKESVYIHLRNVHPKQMINCGVSGCDSEFKTIDQLLQHYHHKTAHKKINLPCDQCKMFGRNKDFQVHLQTQHSIHFDPQHVRHRQGSRSTRSTDVHSKDEVDCDGTDSNEESSEETTSNENQHSQKLVTQQKILNKSINDTDDQDGVDCQDGDGEIEVINDTRQLQSEIIDDDELNGSNIDGHQQQQLVHGVPKLNNSTNQSSFNCLECGKFFSNNYSFKRHLRQVHPKQVFYCGVSGCGKEFKRITHLMAHYLGKMHEKMNIPCDQCRMLGINNDFKEHLQTHHSICFEVRQPVNSTNQFSLKCPECNKFFRNNESFKVHLWKVHPKQMFNCKVSGCGKSCKTIDALLTHYRHNKAHQNVNLPCDQCKMFKKNIDLKPHLEEQHLIDFDH